jgi:hypothetical protein
MKWVHAFDGEDGQSHFETISFEFTQRDGTRTAPLPAESIAFYQRLEGSSMDFHRPPRHQIMLYLTARVELGFSDGTSVVLEPGDALLAEDIAGPGHTSKVLTPGMCAVVPLARDGAD